MLTAQEIIKNLTEGFDIPKETLAGKMRVHSLTITRWQQGTTTPTYAELKLLNQIYRGYNVNRSKSRKNHQGQLLPLKKRTTLVQQKKRKDKIEERKRGKK